MTGAETGARLAGGQAVELVNEAASNQQRCIQREQPGQSLRLFRVDLFVGAGQPPGALDAVAGGGRRRHRLGRRVVQEAPEGVAAEQVVLPGKEDEFVPGIVHGLRGHRHHALPGSVAKVKVVAQSTEDLFALLGRKFRTPGGQPLVEKLAVRVVVDECFPSPPAEPLPYLDDDQREQGGDDEEGDELGHRRSPGDVEAEILDFQIILDPVFRPLASEAGLLDAAEGRHLVRNQPGIDADHAVFQRLANTPAARHVA